MKRNRNSHASRKRGQDRSENTQPAMKVYTMPRNQARLDEKQHEPECKNQSVQMQKQWKRRSAEQRLQVVSPCKPGKNNQECANGNPGIKAAARAGVLRSRATNLLCLRHTSLRLKDVYVSPLGMSP